MTDPKRLIDPGSKSSPRLRTLLRVARSDLPTDDRIGNIGVRLAPFMGGTYAGAPAAGAAAGLKLATAVKLGGVALVTLGVAVGAYVETRDVPSVRPSAPSALLHANPASSGAGRLSGPHPPVDVPDLAASAPVSAPAPALVRAPSSNSVPAFPSETEVSLLESAQDALSTNPGSALSLADSHAARFPHGTLRQEREVIAIEALLRLGRRDEARIRAARFYRAFPGSAHRPRVETLLDDDASSHNR